MPVSAPFTIRCHTGREGIVVSAEPQRLYILMELEPAAKSLPVQHTPPNLSLVLDCSSSMRGERLYYLKQALFQLIEQLQPADRLSVTTFNDRAQLVFSGQSILEQERMRAAIQALGAQGGTELATGLSAGLETLRASSMPNMVDCLILVSDGCTYGDEARCVELAAAATAQGVIMTAFGMGEEWNEELLETLTSGPSGRTIYLRSVQLTGEAFAQVLVRLRQMIAQRLTLELLGPMTAELSACHLVEPCLRAFPGQAGPAGHWSLSLGGWGPGEPCGILLELVIPPPRTGQTTLELSFAVHGDATGFLGGIQASYDLRLPYNQAAPEPTVINQTVRQWIERVTAYRLQTRTWEDVKAGRLAEATQKLSMARTRLLSAGDEAIAQMVGKATARLREAGHADPMAQKQIRYGTRRLMY